MTAQSNKGIRHYVSENIWVIVVDAVGALLLLSLLLTAGGAPALKEYMFVLLTVIPVMAMITILMPARKEQPAAAVTPIRPAVERKIFISPRPYNQRASKAA